jgi:hypothetical protein
MLTAPQSFVELLLELGGLAQQPLGEGRGTQRRAPQAPALSVGIVMANQRNFQGISKRARTSLSGGESKDVDYKEKVKGLHAEDLVAFANSENGGAILIGVREVAGRNGKQKGEPVGHPIVVP